MIKYITNIFKGIWGLMQGMYISMKNMTRPKVTEKYPENRGKKEYFERFRGQLIMPHDENNQHKCTACTICATNCPNGTIKITTRMEMDPETGKERKVLDRYTWDTGACIFCGLCTRNCPQDAIEWSNHFEHSVFNRATLLEQLNKPGSSLKKKPAVAKPTVEKPAAPAVEKPIATEIPAASEQSSATDATPAAAEKAVETPAIEATPAAAEKAVETTVIEAAPAASEQSSATDATPAATTEKPANE